METPSSDTALRLTAALTSRYLVQRELGAGGMATVYLAQDVRHDRKVAIKVLHAELAAVIGAERFLSEIRTTANLQHPHILGLIDSGELDGIPYYVMPFVEGESLRDRLTRDTQLPVQDALRLTSEIASALDFAHRHGVIHRDVKPENILIQDGSALVADFGIALAVSSAGGQRLTQTGLSLGTPAYMSPEQAMGEKTLDARTDVYALGAVLYEMLTGEPPFTGPSAQAIVARVMTERPRPVRQLRETVPPHVESAVHTALAKLAADRFGNAREFREALDDRATPVERRWQTSTAPTTASAPGRSALALLPWAIAALAVLAAATAVWRARSGPVTPMLHASIVPPPGCELAPLSERNLVQLSPSGTDLALIANCGSESALWIRSLAHGGYRRIVGSDNALYPFWSPDGRSIGFFAGGRLRRVDLASGVVRDLAPALSGRGGSWSAEGVIIYAPDVFAPLHRVSADGGEATPVTTLPGDSTQATDRVPMFLPDGRHFIFARGSGRLSGGIPLGEVLVGELGSADTRVLLREPSNVVLAAGHLLYLDRGVLMARPFDASTARFTGDPVVLVPGVEVYPFRFLGQFSGSGERLVYRSLLSSVNRLVLFNPSSRSVTPVLEGAGVQSIRVSPDGRWLLATRRQEDGYLVEPWLYDRVTGRWTRITSRPSLYYILSWAPNSQRFVAQSADDTSGVIRDLDLSAAGELITGATGNAAESWDPGGKFVIGALQASEQGFDVTLLGLDGPDARAEPIGSTSADEQSPRISPDGQLVLFRSNQTGREELFVGSLPDLRGRAQVSIDGVATASVYTTDAGAWSRDGRTIYFMQADGQLMQVSVGPPGAGRFGRPEPVPGAPHGVTALDVDADGRLLLLYSERTGEVPLTLADRWLSLGRRP